jgi:hypothetical protein
MFGLRRNLSFFGFFNTMVGFLDDMIDSPFVGESLSLFELPNDIR